MSEKLEQLQHLQDCGIWRNLLPLSKGKKSPMVPEWHGKDSTGESPPLAHWLSHFNQCNWGGVPAYGVVGIDNDCYKDDDEGGEQGVSVWLAKHSMGYNDLPRTVITTARGRDQDSGIAWFTLPEEYKDAPLERYPNGKDGGVELIRHKTYYAAIPPSRHEKVGRNYMFYEGQFGDMDATKGFQVSIDELAELPKEVCELIVRQEREAPSLPPDPDNFPPAWLESALAYIPADSYGEWLEVGMGLHTGSGAGENGYQIWDEWSQTSDNYVRGECAKKWETFGGVDTPVGLGTIWYSAREHGWEPPEAKERPSNLFYPDEDGIEAAMAYCGIGLRYNDRAYAIELRFAESEGWRPITDRSEAKIRRVLAKRCQMLSGKNKDGEETTAPFRVHQDNRWRTYTNAILADNEVDPLLDYILQCADEVAPFEEHPNLFTAAGFQVDDSIYSQGYQIWASWMAPRVIAARALSVDAPVQADIMPVLIGQQEGGKTTWCKSFFPDPAWVSEGFSWGMDTKKKLEAVGNGGLVIADEMDAMTRATIEAVKSWMSFSTPHCRMAYERHARVHWPRFAMVGTSNDPECLPNDPTGNRRFAPIVVMGNPMQTPASISEWWRINRRRVWSTAVADARRGLDLIRTPAELRDDHRAATLRHTFCGEDQATVTAYLREKNPMSGSLRDIARSAGLSIDLIEDGKFDAITRKALRAEGYSPHKGTQGTRTWVRDTAKWVAPVAPISEVRDNGVESGSEDSLLSLGSKKGATSATSPQPVDKEEADWADSWAHYAPEEY